MSHPTRKGSTRTAGNPYVLVRLRRRSEPSDLIHDPDTCKRCPTWNNRHDLSQCERSPLCGRTTGDHGSPSRASMVGLACCVVVSRDFPDVFYAARGPDRNVVRSLATDPGWVQPAAAPTKCMEDTPRSLALAAVRPRSFPDGSKCGSRATLGLGGFGERQSD